MHGRRVRWWVPAAAQAVAVLAAAGAWAQPAPGAKPAQQAQPAQPVAAAPAPAAAPEKPPLAQSLTGMALAEYSAGVALFKDGDNAGAMARFEEAYKLSRDHRLLWNVALCQRNLRRYVALLDTMRRLEQDAGEQLSAEERQDIADLRKTAAAFVSEIEIAANEPGATVLVDGAAVGTTPLAKPVAVDLGERKVEVRKAGFQAFTRTLRIEGGGRIGVAALLAREVRRGRLSVVAGGNDLITLDGRVVGRGRWEGAVPSGPHALTVSAPKMEAHRSEVLVRDGEARRVEVSLNKKADPNASRVWIWIAGGAALAAGAAITGALLFEPGRPADVGTLGSVPLSFGGRR